MPLCASVPATIDTDTNARAQYLKDMEKGLKNFNDALTATMDSYRKLLGAFDQVAQVYGNMAQDYDASVRKPVDEFRVGMRELKDKGGFDVFSHEVHTGTVAAMDPVKADVKRSLKTLKTLKDRQNEYDTVRFKLESMEKSYAKKNKSLAASKGYVKLRMKREEKKAKYEAARDAFVHEVTVLRTTSESLLPRSLNNYLRCTATFCGQLQATMEGYRTDVDEYGNSSEKKNTALNRLKENAESESAMRRSRFQSGASPLLPNNSGNYQPDTQPMEEGLIPRKGSQMSPYMNENNLPDSDPTTRVHTGAQDNYGTMQDHRGSFGENNPFSRNQGE